MLDRFISNDQVTVCGSRVFILAKRYPNETDYSGYVSKLRVHHSYLSLLVSTSRSGGFWPETLYYLASKTNGICGLSNDEDMGNAVKNIATLGYPYLVYAANPLVYEQGSVDLKPLLIPTSNNYAVVMTLQDTGLMKVVRNISLSWSESIETWNSPIVGNLLYSLQSFTSQLHNMTLTYDYSDGRSRKLQIRIYGSDASFVDNWLPYDD
ncbi:unnamed protein product [Caenorhabditis brenneri]